MHKFKRKCIIITLLALIFSSSIAFAANTNTQNNVNNTTNEVVSNEKNTDENGSTATTILKIKDEQLKSLDDYKTKYGSDTYGIAAYVLHIIQMYSIPIGVVSIAVSTIYQYVIGLKRLDIRDRGYRMVIGMVTILIICQIMPLIFAVVVKSND